jgi:hypothetical protein
MVNITDILNQWANIGVFSYVFPFLLIFAIVFGLLQNLKIFGADEKKTKGINAVIAIALAFMALLNDYVSTFFATIFPRFGIALAIFLVVIILLGFFFRPDDKGKWPGAVSWVGWVLALGVVIWAWNNWSDSFLGGFGFGYFDSTTVWSVILVGGLIGLVFWIVKSGDK